jgi:hypothetical protein
MPVIKCSNGKYRIGSGACIYDSEDKATKVWQAILASGKYSADPNKISYDYDDTLTKERYYVQAKKDVNIGKNVYIVTKRSRSQEVLDMAKKLGISESKVIFTNGFMKWSAINHYGIGTHYDNNAREIELINEKTDAKGIKII